MTTNPFTVLLPDNWKIIRSHLMKDFDSRDCVALQRTCKAAYAMDPGLLWAPFWRSSRSVLSDTGVSKTKTPGLRFEMSARKYTMMDVLFKSGICDNPWFIPPVLLEIECYPTEGDGDSCFLSLTWNLGPGVRMEIIYDKNGVHDNSRTAWCYCLKVLEPLEWIDGVRLSNREEEVDAKTFQGLLKKVPMLGMGISADRIHLASMDDDLASLLLSKRGRSNRH